MGGSESSEDTSTYEFVKNANRSLYGEARLCKKAEANNQVILKDRYCENKEMTDKFQRYLDHQL
jgi:hypothetical protein